MHLRLHYYRSPTRTMADVAKLGITYRFLIPQTMGDQLWLFCCEGVPDDLPPWLTVIKQNPRELIGWGMTEEWVAEVEEWEKTR